MSNLLERMEEEAQGMTVYKLDNPEDVKKLLAVLQQKKGEDDED